MELEYPFKIILYLVVIAVLIGIILSFKSKIMNFCFFPPCEKKEECGIETQKVSEKTIDENVIDKYCFLCLSKSENCQNDKVCYIMSLDESFDFENDYILVSDPEKCEITCNKNTQLVYFSYNYLEDKVQIGC